MSQLELQKYLRNNHTLLDLKEEFGIDVSTDERVTPHRHSFNYNLIKSPMKEKICQECRGLVLEDGTWDILAYPFNKFFNYGELEVKNIDWNSACYYEKLDGSMVILWFDPVVGNWNFGTRSVCRGGNTMPGMSCTFKELAVEGLPSSLDYSLLNKRYTYIFELTSPYNRMVCEYKNILMTLIGVRDLDTLLEIPIENIASQLQLPTPKKYSFNSIEDMIKVINDWNPVEHEGVVVVDKYFERIKVKNIAYIAAHGAISHVSASNRNLLKIIIMEKDDDLVPIMSDWLLNKTKEIKNKYRDLIIQIEKDWNEFKHIVNDKEFALTIKYTTWPSVLFSLRQKKATSIEDYMRNTHIDSILSRIGEKP